MKSTSKKKKKKGYRIIGNQIPIRLCLVFLFLTYYMRFFVAIKMKSPFTERKKKVWRKNVIHFFDNQ